MVKIQRLNAHQFLTSASSDTALRACWHILTQKGIANAFIDTKQSVVSGSNKGRFFSAGESYKAHVELRAEGVLISVFCRATRPTLATTEVAKCKAVEVSQGIEALIEAGFYTTSYPLSATSTTSSVFRNSARESGVEEGAEETD